MVTGLMKSLAISMSTLLILSGVAIAKRHSNNNNEEEQLTDDQVKYLAADYAEYLYGVRGDTTWPSSMRRHDADPTDPPAVIRKRAPQQRYCGGRLIELVTKVCDGCLAPPTGTQRVKPRSSRPVDNQPIRTKRAGLATRCCHNACDIDDVKAYCCK